MKWFDNFINRPITKILRLDRAEDYEFFQPYAIFLLFDTEIGLLIGAINDGKSIQIDSSTLTEIYDDYGVEFGETCLNQLKKDDELKVFIGQSIRKIKVGEYKTDEIIGDNFIIKQDTYSGIIIETEKNKFTYYNDHGGHIWIDDELEFPNPERWVLTQNGC
jgi:hypothetical protein